eukprot:TRINITY_DN11309_c0_g1_i2.p1 TRINITY_DN11309_c0_g1~~TRINITY_DN11309_c0_g1_i2.p1  ORF type:complete len:388 (-),score=61.66 TRINITY_DN11309_c0_g1_i2:224-1342(-)
MRSFCSVLHRFVGRILRRSSYESLLSTYTNERMVLARNSGCDGLPKDSDFSWQRHEIKGEELDAGKIVCRVQYLGFQPSMLKAIQAQENACMPDGLKAGDTPSCYGVGTVVASRSDKFQEGDLVWADMGWQRFAVLNEDAKYLRKLDASYEHPSHFLSVFSMTSYTAYFGFFDVGRPKKGDVVMVSAAAGAVGLVVCQMALESECHVIALTSKEEKATALREIGVSHVVVTDGSEGYDALVNKVKSALPEGKQGVDIYWDNVGGEVTDVALAMMNKAGRVVVCGRISTYLQDGESYRMINLEHILLKQLRIQGFLILDYMARVGEANAYIKEKVSKGAFKFKEDIIDGLENAPAALNKLFKRENIGKVLIRL